MNTDVGANGRCIYDDIGICGNSSIEELLDDDNLGVLKPQKMPGSDKIASFVLLGDDTFGLKTNLMKPFLQRRN